MAKERYGKRRPGRPTKEERPLSEKEKAQRRGAAYKTGEHSAAPLARMVPPCKEACCPLGEDKFPCEIKEDRDQAGQVTERCASYSMVQPSTLAAVSKALEEDDDGPIRPWIARLMGASFDIAEIETGKLKKEGLAITREIPGPDGELYEVLVENPRAKPTLTLLQNLGITAKDQALTPASRAARKRDDGIGNLMDFLHAKANQ